MSWSERYVQDRRRRTDRAIHRAFEQLASDPLILTKFQELLACTRKCAPRLFEAPVRDYRHLGVDALVNLSRFRREHLRPASDWAGSDSSWRPAVASLAHHLLCAYKAPTFLASSWYANDANADRKRGWFIAHSRGASFRSLDLPIAMTRKMEHLFLTSQDHLPIEHAMRRAELLALGAPAEVVKAVLSTRLATDLRDSEFWRTVWMFLIANSGEMDSVQIGPLVDYLQAFRELQTQHGLTPFGSHQPDFSMKGRTVQSMLRLMRDWHRSLGTGGASLSWTESPFHSWVFDEVSPNASEKPRRWQMVELTSSAQLRSEGAALHHCVASYAYRCHRGTSSIWSLRFWQAERIHHMLTVEVDPKLRMVVQARGRANREPSGKPLRLLQEWAVRERLRMLI
jgi:hypothetical protein